MKATSLNRNHVIAYGAEKLLLWTILMKQYVVRKLMPGPCTGYSIEI